MRVDLTQRLNKNLPLYTPGEQVEVVSAGVVYRGIFRGSTATSASLEVKGSVLELPFESLDRASRARIDKIYREEMVDIELKKQVQRMSK